jgi:hypothetical protein
MARTIAEIKQEMIDAKNADSNLDGLTSTSSTAVWNLFFFIVAASIAFFESLFDLFKEDIEQRATEIPTGTLQWYAAESLVFQNGDALELIDGVVTYPIIDTDKQIVKLAAASESNGLVTIKAAKLNGTTAEPLTAGEKTSFEGYWTDKRFAGTALQVISQNPDLLKALYRIKVNPSVIDPTTGESIAAPGTYPVEDAINAFLQEFQGENFAGDMQVMKLTDAIQAVSGVRNAVANTIEAKPDGGAFVDVLASDEETYQTTAGYMAVDPAFPLNTTLTYTV